jgi:hypothetical protein
VPSGDFVARRRAQKAIRYLAGKLGVGIFGPNGE